MACSYHPVIYLSVNYFHRMITGRRAHIDSAIAEHMICGEWGYPLSSIKEGRFDQTLSHEAFSEEIQAQDFADITLRKASTIHSDITRQLRLANQKSSQNLRQKTAKIGIGIGPHDMVVCKLSRPRVTADSQASFCEAILGKPLSLVDNVVPCCYCYRVLIKFDPRNLSLGYVFGRFGLSRGMQIARN